MDNRKPLTTVKFKKMKQECIPISMITAYDYPSAILAQEAGIDAILVGDSLGNVVLGYDTTVPVTLDDIIYHTRAVTRAATNCFVIADMPFMTYHGSIDNTLGNVARLMQEGLPQSVKMEGGAEIAETVAACVQAGVPVMGHLGLTPQSVHRIGGYIVQGKNSIQAQKLLDDAKSLEQAGAFAIVLELVSESLAAYITEQISIPTIGIGASASCDGQVLVYHDLLQYGSATPPKKMVKTYANIGEIIRMGISAYVQDVKSRQFPQKEHVFQSEDWRD
jgi:3-methyl-2-oxobutanoate hydroxymethyltransferase